LIAIACTEFGGIVILVAYEVPPCDFNDSEELWTVSSFEIRYKVADAPLNVWRVLKGNGKDVDADGTM
jgi:hypothetical protein